MDEHLQGLADIIETTVGDLKAADVLLSGFNDKPTVAGIQPLGPVTIIDMTDGTATAPVPTAAKVTVRRGDGEGDWECYGCGYHIPALTKGFDTRCPLCGSFELHLTDDAKARRT